MTFETFEPPKKVMKRHTLYDIPCSSRNSESADKIMGTIEKYETSELKCNGDCKWTDSHSFDFDCGNSNHEIVMLSLQDINGVRPISNERQNTSQVEDVCREKWRLLGRHTRDVSQDQFEEACGSSIDYQIRFMQSLVKGCHKVSRRCHVPRPELANAELTCERLNSLDLHPIIRIEFICRFDWWFRDVHMYVIRDVVKTYSCDPDQILYVFKVGLLVLKGDSPECSFEQRESGNCSQEVSFEANLKLLDFTKRVAKFEYLVNLPRLVLERCHAEARCHLDFNQMIKMWCKSRVCDMDARVLDESVITIEYVCLPAKGFDFARDKPLEDEMAANVTKREVTFTNLLDHLDAIPVLETEVGPVKYYSDHECMRRFGWFKPCEDYYTAGSSKLPAPTTQIVISVTISLLFNLRRLILRQPFFVRRRA